MTLDHVSIELIDTAGFETATGEISASAQEHRNQQESAADLRVLCIDAQMVQTISDSPQTVAFIDLDSSATQWIQTQIQNLRPHDLIVLNKVELLADLPSTSEVLRLTSNQPGENPQLIPTSSITGSGLEQLGAQIANSLRRDAGDSVVGSTVQRASISLVEAAESLDAAIGAADSQLGDEIVAAEIRDSLNALGQVVGTVYTDDILDLVFGRFCIGK